MANGKLPTIDLSAALGVKHESWTESDYYEGTKDQLTAIGIPADWFPIKLKSDSRGRVKRRYAVEGWSDWLLSVKAQDKQGIRWSVVVPASEEEHARRKEEKRQADLASLLAKDAAREERYQRLLKARLQTLHQFSDCLTEGEKQHLRVLRALDDDSRGIVLSLAERYLIPSAAIDAPEKQKPVLRLVKG